MDSGKSKKEVSSLNILPPIRSVQNHLEEFNGTSNGAVSFEKRVLRTRKNIFFETGWLGRPSHIRRKQSKYEPKIQLINWSTSGSKCHRAWDKEDTEYLLEEVNYSEDFKLVEELTMEALSYGQYGESCSK